MCDANLVRNDRGQTIIVFALVVPILILFTGLAIDAGLLYVTKAKLSTAVDAACLTGMKNLSNNTPEAQARAAQLAGYLFNANFGANPPTPTIAFPTDAYGDQQVSVTATAYVNTLFIRYLPRWATVPVAATAVATRGKLIMTLVLDRSGSMISDGGQAALQVAVPQFIANFSNTLDEVALISFSSNARIDFPIAFNFITPITNAVSGMHFDGGTFGTGAGTQPILSNTIGPPLSLAQLQNDGVPIQPGQNVVRVVVYFTDGLMNAVQDSIHCGGTTINTPTLLNYGGYDSGGTVSILDPTCSPANSAGTSCTNEAGHVSILDTSGGSGFPSGFKYDYPAGDICRDASGTVVTKFTPQRPGNCWDGSGPPPCPFNRTNVTKEAQYRAIQTAIALRTDAPVPTYVYTIGLGVNLTTQDLLAQLANDPAYPATYIKGQPAGEFFYIPDCPSSTCTTELNTAFQVIASKILLRLTQ